MSVYEIGKTIKKEFELLGLRHDPEATVTKLMWILGRDPRTGYGSEMLLQHR